MKQVEDNKMVKFGVREGGRAGRIKAESSIHLQSPSFEDVIRQQSKKNNNLKGEMAVTMEQLESFGWKVG